MKESEVILFEKYLAGTLSIEEQTSFEQHLKTDAAFKEDFALFQKMDNFLLVRDAKKERLAQLNAIASQHIVSINKKKASLTPMWIKRVAATILLIVSFYFILQLVNAKPTYEEYAIHQALALTTQGDNTITLQQAEQYFNAKKYQQALTSFEELSPEETTLEITITKAICLLELHRTADAIAILQPIAQGNSARKNDALWYLGLAALQSEDWGKVKLYLKQIPSKTFHGEKARTLLRRID